MPIDMSTMASPMDCNTIGGVQSREGPVLPHKQCMNVKHNIEVFHVKLN